jgi:hypothetical protein
MSTEGEVYETSPFLVNGPEVFVLGDGRVLANDVIRTPDRVGLPAHILGSDGRPSLSFGNDSESPQGYQFGGSYRRVSLSGGDKIWVAPVGDYRLELWDSAGVHLRTLVREAPWFHPWLRDTPGQPFRERPNTKILSVHQDHRGMVWVFARIPDRNWQSGVEYPAYEHVYDVIVEVIDLSSGELITSQRFEAPEHFFFGFFTEGLVSSSSVNELGVEQIHIWRMRLQRPGRKGEDP